MMPTVPHPRRLPALLLASAAASALLVAGAGLASPQSAAAEDADASSHEIWALDQGQDLDRVHVYGPDLDEREVIDFEDAHDEVTTPHMIAFDSQHRYAAVASTTSRNVTIIRTSDYEVVDTLETGAGAHMASFAPGDETIWVANIGAATFTPITADLDAEEFAVDATRELDVTADPAWQAEFADVDGGGGGGARDDVDDVPAPVCHEYTADGRFAYVTLGPGAGGLVVVDIAAEQPSVVQAFPRDDVKANCGLARAADGSKMYANWGDPGPEDEAPDATGEWYVFDTRDHTLLQTSDDTRGVDAHGVRLHPAGDRLWQVNRGSSNGIVIDTETDEILDEEEIVDTGDSPDILDFSPEGDRVYTSLRGPNPLSGAAHVATGETPGFSVIDVGTREIDAIVEPAADDPDEHEQSDFHGLGVRISDPARRIGGADRIATAAATSQDQYADGEAGGVVIARADVFPDALAGTPLAAAVDGPLLLTRSGGLSDAAAAELGRVLDAGGTVHLLGGEAALSAEVADDVEALGYEVERLAGADRYATSVRIAEALGEESAQLLTTGEDFPDALAAGAAAAHAGGAVLLTAEDGPGAAVADYLADHEAERFAVGGPAAQGHPDARALVGEDRYETALEVAGEFFAEASFAGLARGDEFPDALAGGVHAAANGGPVLLTEGSELHSDVAEYVCGQHDTGDDVAAYGGPRALSEDVLVGATGRLHGAGC